MLADSCGDDYQYVAQSVSITTDPPIDCLEMQVTGSNQPGCDQLEFVVQNACGQPLSAETSWDPQLRCDPAPLGGLECTEVDDGGTLGIYLPAHEEGSRAYNFHLYSGGLEVRVDVSFKVVDEASGCTASRDRAPRGGFGSVAWAMLVGLLTLCRRRRG